VTVLKEMVITSPVFKNKGFIPSRYTCDGTDVNPPLSIEGTPEGTKSLVLIVDDPDSTIGTWDHWIVWNISPTRR
jgi:Raf kinase inhibitor-like YbhB/YbcL family protein